MNSIKSLLSAAQREQLTTADRLDFGSFKPYKPNNGVGQFIVELDARPLDALIEAAQYGSRLYELMTISRPADVLHYLHLTMIDVHEDVLSHVQGRIKFRTRFKNVTFENGISFTEFDSCFAWADDDTSSYERNWLTHRGGAYWNQKMHALLSLTKDVQHLVRKIDDFLIQHEIKLIDQGLHHRDALVQIDRIPLLKSKATSQTTLPAPLFETIAQLIKRDDVKSVSCPFTDFPLWRLLVEEQIRRAQASGLPPQKAFYLSSCDGGQMNLTGADSRRYPNEPHDWGGTVHVPYEGATGGDLFIEPDWHGFPWAITGEGGKFSRVSSSKPCRFLLSERNYANLECASRTQIGNWILYTDEQM